MLQMALIYTRIPIMCCFVLIHTGFCLISVNHLYEEQSVGLSFFVHTIMYESTYLENKSYWLTISLSALYSKLFAVFFPFKSFHLNQHLISNIRLHHLYLKCNERTRPVSKIFNYDTICFKHLTIIF